MPTYPRVVELNYAFRISEFYTTDLEAVAAAEAPKFRVAISGGRAVVEVLVDLTTEQEARDLVEPFLDAWEMRAGTLRAYPMFEFQFVDSRIAASAELSSGNADVRSALASAFQLPSLPELPEHAARTPWSRLIWKQFESFRRGQRALVPTAYMCLTLLETAAAKSLGGARGSRRAAAARLFGLDVDHLNRLGELTAAADPIHGRTVGHGPPRLLSSDELAWIERMLAELVRVVVDYDLRAG